MKTKEIKQLFEDAKIEQLDELIKKFELDERSTVKKIVQQYKRKKQKHIDELARLQKMLTHEKELYFLGFEYICGIDEVGRGPLAGPVVSACVIMPKGVTIEGVNDSKKLNEKTRERLFDEIKTKAIAYSVGIVTADEIDEINILNATKKSMYEAIHKLTVKPDYLLIDAVRLEGININQTNIIKGDEKSHSIACASIIAKVTRDNMMKQYDELFIGYNFSSNKGYGSKEHTEAIKQLGSTPIHRKSFIKNIVGE